MTRAALLAKIPRAYSLNQIIQAKQTWRVSAAAINYRLHKVGAVSDWLYRRINIQLSEAYGQTEPNGIPREVSLLWVKVLAQLRGEKITKHDIAYQLGLPIAEFEGLIFGRSRMQSIDGKGSFLAGAVRDYDSWSRKLGAKRTPDGWAAGDADAPHVRGSNRKLLAAAA